MKRQLNVNVWVDYIFTDCKLKIKISVLQFSGGEIIEYPSTFETTFEGRNTNQRALNSW